MNFHDNELLQIWKYKVLYQYYICKFLVFYKKIRSVKSEKYTIQHIIQFFVLSRLNSLVNIKFIINNQRFNTSIIVYADDIILISPVDSQLQQLLDLCTNYGKKWLIKFNPKKSNIVSFGKSIVERNFILNNSSLTEVNEIKYLGYIINNKLNSNDLKKFKTQ